MRAAAFAALLQVIPHSLSAAEEKTIVKVAAGAGQFNTLVAAVKAAGLADTLNGKGPFTVFAPTDEALYSSRRARSRTCSSQKTRSNWSPC